MEFRKHHSVAQTAKYDYKKIANVVLCVLAYGFLGYKLVTYDNYPGLAAQFRQAALWQWLCLAGCVLLFPVNRFFESCKWRYLVRGIEPMNLWEAQRQVYYGTIAGFVTPYKLGEYPGRALLFRHTRHHWLTATCLGIIGGYAMTTVVIVGGLPAVLEWLSPDGSMLWSIAVALMSALVAIFALPALMRRLQSRPWKSEQTRMLIDNMAGLTVKDVSVLIGLSLLRYTVFLGQLLLVLLFSGVVLDAETMLVVLPLYFLLITVTPAVPAAELAVRGAWAVVIFERFGADVSAAAVIAALLLWTINTILPLLVGTFVRLRSPRP